MMDLFLNERVRHVPNLKKNWNDGLDWVHC